jgi:hypothetical protein
MPETETKSKQRQQLVGVMELYTVGYLERFNNYLELNFVEDDNYKILLVTNMIGPAASGKISKSCKPKQPKEFKYAQIIQKCKSIFYGERSSITEHYKFNNRNQHEGELANDFAIELQAIAEHCKFEGFLDTALRDRFVAGLRSSEVKSKVNHHQ